MEQTILFLENGDDYRGMNFDKKEALKILKEKGYKKAYSGRKFNKFGMKVLVGVNDKNTVKIVERRKNGLWNAKEINL